jgi:hypothetical protein
LELSKTLQKAAKNSPSDPSSQAVIIGEHIRNNLKVMETLAKTLKTYQARKSSCSPAGRSRQPSRSTKSGTKSARGGRS